MRETKTVQVKPDDEIVNNTIKEYESFGWEVLNNQRCQEQEVRGGLIYFVTFNKITFTREKSTPWYDEVTQLEKQHNEINNTIETYKDAEPEYSPVEIYISVSILLFLLGIIPGIIYLTVLISKKKEKRKAFEKELEYYNATYPAKIQKAKDEQAELRIQAEKCINENS